MAHRALCNRLLRKFVELADGRLVRHPGGLALVGAEADEPAVGRPSGVQVRLRDAVVRWHNVREAIDLVPQVIPDLPLQGRPLLRRGQPPLVEHLVQLGVVYAPEIDGLGGGRVVRQMHPVYKAWARTRRAPPYQGIREWLSAQTHSEPRGSFQLLDFDP